MSKTFILDLNEKNKMIISLSSKKRNQFQRPQKWEDYYEEPEELKETKVIFSNIAANTKMLMCCETFTRISQVNDQQMEAFVPSQICSDSFVWCLTVS